MGVEHQGWVLKDDELLKFYTKEDKDGFIAYLSNNLTDDVNFDSFWGSVGYTYYNSIQDFKTNRTTAPARYVVQQPNRLNAYHTYWIGYDTANPNGQVYVNGLYE